MIFLKNEETKINQISDKKSVRILEIMKAFLTQI